MFKISKLEGEAFLVGEGFHEIFKEELRLKVGTYEKYGDLFWLKEVSKKRPIWYQNHWKDLSTLEFESIKDCANGLTSIQRNWSAYLWNFQSRGTYIEKALPHVSKKHIEFHKDLPTTPLGSFTLIGQKKALISADCSSPFSNGAWEFLEDKEGPPSRAYLKLWEALLRFQNQPSAGDLCLDLGASPGGWTWVLEDLRARVVAIDRAPLTPALMKSRFVTFQTGNAFGIELEDYPDASWLFCDVICYPEKLYDFITQKLFPSSIKYAICTIKFQGREHYKKIEDFKKLPNSTLVHLYQNKHELTWFYTKP